MATEVQNTAKWWSNRTHDTDFVFKLSEIRLNTTIQKQGFLSMLKTYQQYKKEKIIDIAEINGAAWNKVWFKNDFG